MHGGPPVLEHDSGKRGSISNRSAPHSALVSIRMPQTPPQSCLFFWADSSSLIAWDNFKAAKAIVALVPSRGGHGCRPGVPKGLL
jgi:hypothetical protein